MTFIAGGFSFRDSSSRQIESLTSRQTLIHSGSRETTALALATIAVVKGLASDGSGDNGLLLMILDQKAARLSQPIDRLSIQLALATDPHREYSLGERAKGIFIKLAQCPHGEADQVRALFRRATLNLMFNRQVLIEASQHPATAASPEMHHLDQLHLAPLKTILQTNEFLASLWRKDPGIFVEGLERVSSLLDSSNSERERDRAGLKEALSEDRDHVAAALRNAPGVQRKMGLFLEYLLPDDQNAKADFFETFHAIARNRGIRAPSYCAK